MSRSIPLSIAIPTYNRADKAVALAKALAPQLSQDDEIVVLDDCSQDGTAQRLEAISAVRVVRHAVNKGMVKNWNACFELTKHDWVCIIHDDDIAADEALSTIRMTCRTISKPALVSQPWPLFAPNLDGRYHYRVYSPGPSAVMASGLSPSGAVIHRSIYETLGGFDESLAYSADVEYFARISAHYPLVIVESPAVVSYQLHDDNYQYKTWAKHDFWPQWERIVRLILSYANFDEDTTARLFNDHTAATLGYILRTAAQKKDKLLLRKYGRLAWRASHNGKRLRLQGFVAATLGRYLPI